MGSNIDDQVIAGTNINKNPELLPPKVVKTVAERESGVIESPLSDDFPLPPAGPPKPKIKVKKEIHLREIDNGYILNVSGGTFHEEWGFSKLSKVIRAMVAFLNTSMEE